MRLVAFADDIYLPSLVLQSLPVTGVNHTASRSDFQPAAILTAMSYVMSKRSATPEDWMLRVFEIRGLRCYI